MFAAPPFVTTSVYATLPEALRLSHRMSPWAAARGGGPLHSFLEGPSFDRAGNLFCVDVAHSRIFRISLTGEWDVFAEYEGEPNGLKIHRDGRIFVADRHHGLLCFDPSTRERTVVAAGPDGGRFYGLNDLTFASNGDVFITDQGDSALNDPFGRVFRLRATGELDLLIDNLAGPNGLVLSRDEKTLYVAITRANQVVSVPLQPSYAGVGKCGVFLQLSGSPVGPDGMALDEEGSLAVVHAGFGTVWLFSRFGEPLYRIGSCAGLRTTNVAYGGVDRRSLFITEADAGVILRAELSTIGVEMYAQR